MKCPICHKPVSIEDSKAPFCSERCRLLDFDNWTSGRYVISTPAPPQHQKGDESAEDENY